MTRSLEAQQAIDAAADIFNDTSRNLFLSPVSLEFARRDLVRLRTTQADLRNSASRLPPLLDPDHIVHTLHDKIGPASVHAQTHRQYVPVALDGREIDFLTRMMVPYTPDKKPTWVENNTQQEMERYYNTFQDASYNDLKAYAEHAKNLAVTQLGMREGVVREIHEAWEIQGGERRQSFIDRMALFEAKTQD